MDGRERAVIAPGRANCRRVAVAALLGAVLGFAPSAIAAGVPVGEASASARPACGPVAPDRARCFAIVREQTSPGSRQAGEGAAAPQSRGAGAASAGPAGGLTPEDLASAYGYSPKASGAGQTVGIVDAYDDPSIQSDLGAFDAHYGLPECTAANGCLTKVGQSGGAAPGADTTGWSIEISLDVETVHAVCPNCKILLVEANSSLNSNLAAAANEAVALGATVVSSSFGSREAGYGASERAAFEHPGVPIVAATGDWGWDNWNFFEPESQSPNDPAALPSVIAVGATRLELADGARASESVWNWNDPAELGADEYVEGVTGGGCSALYQAPPWQLGEPDFAASGCGDKRLDADVAAVGDPETGLDVYDTYDCGKACKGGDEGWETIGGTSLSAPLIASLYALAGGGHGLKYPALTLYGRAASHYDVTAGGNGFCDDEPASTCREPEGFGRLDCAGETQCDAARGFDGPSGVGTPIGLGLFEPEPPSAVISAPSSLSAESPASFGAAASESAYPGGTIASASWSWGDGATGSGVAAAHTYATPGSYTVTLTVTDSYGLTSSHVTKTVEVGAAKPREEGPKEEGEPKEGKQEEAKEAPGTGTSGGGSSSGGTTNGGGSSGDGGGSGSGSGGGGGSGSGSGSGGASGSGASGSGGGGASEVGAGSQTLPTGGALASITATPTATVALAGSAISVSAKGAAAVKLSCSGAATCSGSLTIVAKTPGRHGRRVRIGTASFSIAAGASGAVAVRLTAVGRSLLRSGHGHLGASLTIAKSSPVPATELTRAVRLSQKRS